MVAARCYCAHCRAAGGRAGARGRYGVRRGRRRFQPRLVRILSGRHGGGGVGIAWPQDQHPVQRRLLSRYGDAGCGERDGCAGDQAARDSHRTGGRLQLAGAAVAVGRRHRGRCPIAASERRRAVRSRRLSGIPPRVFHCRLRRECRLATHGTPAAWLRSGPMAVLRHRRPRGGATDRRVCVRQLRRHGRVRHRREDASRLCRRRRRRGCARQQLERQGRISLRRFQAEFGRQQQLDRAHDPASRAAIYPQRRSQGRYPSARPQLSLRSGRRGRGRSSPCR